MEKTLTEYNVHELALSINESCQSMKLAVEQLRKGNDYGTEHYKLECLFWSKRAVDAVIALSLDPKTICPKQEAWAEKFSTELEG
jgi:hypothetical protein